MPYVKSISVHATVDKSLRYILNPDKTESQLYTVSINCTTDAHDAYLQMKAVYEHYARAKYNSPPPLEGKGTVKAIHYIMSFADSENVTPELAHKLAMTFVLKNFGDEVHEVKTENAALRTKVSEQEQQIGAFKSELSNLKRLYSRLREQFEKVKQFIEQYGLGKAVREFLGSGKKKNGVLR